LQAIAHVFSVDVLISRDSGAIDNPASKQGGQYFGVRERYRMDIENVSAFALGLRTGSRVILCLKKTKNWQRL
jgi:hypothetical protein